MAQNKIRVGLIGAGGNTRSRHIPGLKTQAGVELAAVANRSVASGRKIAREFGIEKVCTDWHEILDDSSIDAVCIGTSTNANSVDARIIQNLMPIRADLLNAKLAGNLASRSHTAICDCGQFDARLRF